MAETGMTINVASANVNILLDPIRSIRLLIAKTPTVVSPSGILSLSAHSSKIIHTKRSKRDCIESINFACRTRRFWRVVRWGVYLCIMLLSLYSI